MELYDIDQLWTTYQQEMCLAEAKLTALYGMPIFLLGRAAEYCLLGALVGILAVVVGVQL